MAYITGKTTTSAKSPPLVYALCGKISPPEGGWRGNIATYYWIGGVLLAIIISAGLAVRAHRRVDAVVAEEETDLGAWG